MANRKRNIQMKFYVTEEEKRLIDEKMALLSTRRYIKAVQGDSGHAQVSMVTDVYSHILDDDRKKNAELFEEAFYEKKNLDPQMHPNTAENTVVVPEGMDAELLAKVLNNPEMAALLTSLAKTMK